MTMEYYRGLLAQPTRIEAFQREISEKVKEGDRVLEIGAGLGTYSFFAADAGAGRVTGIEGGPIQSVASTIARYNSYTNVEFVRGWFPAIAPAEKVDVVIFEDYPPRLLGHDSYGLLHEIVHGALRPGGTLIPARARISMAPVASPRLWSRLKRFGTADDRAYGIDWEPMLEYLQNHPQESSLGRDDLAAEPAIVRVLDLIDVPGGDALAGETSWEFGDDVVLHGLAYWFELEVGGTWLSNAPETDPGSWGNLFLPFDKPLAVGGGESVRAGVTPECTGSGAPGWLRWTAETVGQKRVGHEFRSRPASLSDILPVESLGRVTPGRDAGLEVRILQLAEKGASVSEILADLSEGVETSDSGDSARLRAESILKEMLARNVLKTLD